jgi:GT2 family glycosyltransferase
MLLDVLASHLAPPSVGVVITCYNRVDLTLRCLASVYKQPSESYRISVYVVDAGSTDGTPQLISAQWPQTTVIQADDSVFWNAGMRLGFARAISDRFDYYLWLNDDTILHDDALDRLMATSRQIGVERELGVIVGVVRDPSTDSVSYGGWLSKSRWNRSKVTRMESSPTPLKCDTINGNCVLIPNAVVERVGNLDPAFSHGMGDMDYGFRANDAGCSTWIIAGFCGECCQNRGLGLWNDGSLPLIERMRRMLGPKGLPLKEWFVFTRRYAGPLWFVYWLRPYTKLVITGLWALLMQSFKKPKAGVSW